MKTLLMGFLVVNTWMMAVNMDDHIGLALVNAFTLGWCSLALIISWIRD